MIIFLAFALLLTGLASASDSLFESPFIDCPQPCTCFSTSSGDIQVNCEAPTFVGSNNRVIAQSSQSLIDQQLLDFHMLPHNATKISVYRGTGLQLLPGRSFTPFRTLSTLEIRLSDLQDLDEMAFAGLRTLRVLNLQLNAIRTLSRNVFRQTVWLTELRLDENVIEDLPDGIFDQLRTLRVLDLSKNRLANIRPGMFAGLSLLQELRLVRNRIVELDVPVFSAMANLHSLDLSGNALKRISGPAFANLTALNHLDLSSNQLSFVDPSAFRSVQDTLQRLYLCDNPWICDCPLVQLKQWIDNVKVLPTQASSQFVSSIGVIFDKPPKANEPLCRTTCRLPSLISGASLVNMREASVYCPTTTTTTSTSTASSTEPETTVTPLTTNLATSLSGLLLGISPPAAKKLDFGNITTGEDGGTGAAAAGSIAQSANSPSNFDMTISVAVSVAVAGVLLLIIMVSIIVYQVKKCQARRRRYKRHPAIQGVIGNGSALGGSNSVLVPNNGKLHHHQQVGTLFPGGLNYGAPYIGDITSGGGSTGSDLVSDSKSDSSAGSPNGLPNYHHQNNGRVAGVFGLSYGGDQWSSPTSGGCYYGVGSTSSTTVLGGYPPSLSLNPMPIPPSVIDQSQGAPYPTSISLNFPSNPHSTSTPGKPFSFIGGASSHDIMTSSFPPPPPQSAIAILDALHNEHMAQQHKNNLSSSSRSESLV